MEGGGSEQSSQKIGDVEDAINGEERVGGENEEEFYEQIEAPKFVDFTLPDAFRPDDRYWFCSRVGCDRKHEEVIDPEEISKNFVLRVMAARSPNIKLRKALNAKCSGVNMKCPLSAPAKSSKPRILRVAMVSSISHKLVEPKEKVKPPSKINSTPIAKSKQVAAKYMTTPRRKKSVPTSNSFRSVQNPKQTSVLVPKNQSVVKSLVFHSPKKGISVKRSVDLLASLTKICEGVKKLEIANQKKQILGYSSKSSKEIRSSSKKPFPKDHSGRRVSFLRKRRVSFLKVVKRLSKESMPPQKSKDQEMKSSRGIKTNGRNILTNQHNYMTKQTNGHGSSDIMTEIKSRGVSRVIEDIGNEDQPTLGITENSSPAEAKISESSQNVEEKSGCQPLQDSGLINNDDKENVLTSDVNRDNNCDNKQSGKKVLGSQETLKNKKAARLVHKNLKDGLLPATTGPILLKYKKPKLTNPKPFRLRTDERGILKEANLDRKPHFTAPQNDAAKDSAFSGGNSKRTHGKVSEGGCQKDELDSGATQREHQSVTPKSENSLTRTRSPHLREKLVTPRRVSSTKKANVPYIRSGKQLGVITETSKRTKPSKEENVTEFAASSAPRLTSRLKRPSTFPNEPNFQSTHPKTCTKNVIEISVLS